LETWNYFTRNGVVLTTPGNGLENKEGAAWDAEICWNPEPGDGVPEPNLDAAT
jgi:hypothetical protein